MVRIITDDSSEGANTATTTATDAGLKYNRHDEYTSILM